MDNETKDMSVITPPITDEKKVYDIDNVPIFEAGKWNGDDYTEEDIDKMVESFAAIGGRIKPFVKLGHDEEQKLLQKDGYPAAGWITELKRIGKTLYAKFSNVPEKIYQLIQAKAYGRFSAEIFWNLREGDTVYSRVLRAVALLGADTPAVTSLDDFVNLYENTEYDIIKICTQREEITMSEDVKKYEAEIESLKKQNEELKKYEIKMGELAKENEELKTGIEKEKERLYKSEVKAYIDEQMKAGKIIPAQVPLVYAICSTDEVKLYMYNENDEEKKVDGRVFDLFKQFVDLQAKVVEFSETSNATEVDKSKGLKEGHEVLDGKVKEYVEKNKVSYKEAYKAVAHEEGGK